VLCGYLGISWIAPALLIRAAARTWAAIRIRVLAGLVGWTAAAVFATMFLIAAAAIIGV
jgi:hypothetical protein